MPGTHPPTAHPPRRLSRRRRLLFALVPAVILFGGAEGLLRILGQPEQKYLAERFEFPPARKFGRVYERDPALFWRLVPGCDEPWTDFKVLYTREWLRRAVSDAEIARRRREFPHWDYYRTVTWEVGEHGFRGPPPRAGTDLILFLGDSVTFGWGTRAEDSFTAVIRRRLERAAPAWEVFNAAVPGYTSYQSLVLLRRLLADLAPRVIVFSAGINDGIPSTGAADADYAMARRGVVPPTVIRSSNLLLLAYLATRGAGAPATPEEVGGDGPPFFGVSVYEPGHSRVPPAAFRDNLAAVRELAAAEGAALYFLFPPLYDGRPGSPLTDSVNLALGEEIDLRAVLAARAEEPASFFLPWDEVHYSVLGHRIVADAAWDRLVADGIIPASTPP